MIASKLRLGLVIVDILLLYDDKVIIGIGRLLLLWGWLLDIVGFVDQAGGKVGVPARNRPSQLRCELGRLGRLFLLRLEVGGNGWEEITLSKSVDGMN